MISEKIYKKIYSIYPIIISLLITGVWFRQKIMMATAEEGIPFYNLERTFNVYSSYFYDSGLGLEGVFNVPRTPLFGFLSLFQKIGFAGWQIQAVVFFLLLLTPLLSIPRLTKELFDKDAKIIGFAASVFYLFNLFTLSQVWTRFILSLIFLWSYLPLFLLLWVKYINTFKFKYLIILLVTSFIFSPAFAIFSPAITIWITASVFSLSSLIKNKNKLKIIKFSIIGFVLWVLTNLWWLYPFYQARDSNIAANVSVEQNVKTLAAVSNYYPNGEIFLLKQKYMFGESSPYYDFYKTGLSLLLSKAIFIFVIVGVLVSLRKKNYFFMVLLLLISWFLVKGANPPFGKEFYEFAFRQMQVMQTYRNPYEKIGSMYLLAYSFLFAIGSVWISGKFKKLKNIVFAVILVILCGYLLTPMINGSLFKNITYVIVPGYYEFMNKIIQKEDENDNRILQLPLLRGTSIQYDWNYFGEEPSEFLFDKTSVSRTSSIPIVDELYYKLGDPKFFRLNKNFSKILSVMKIRYIVLHKDVILSTYHQEGIDDTRMFATAWNDVKYLNADGKLELYKNSSLVENRLYLVDDVFRVGNLEEAFDIIVSTKFDPNTDVVLISPQDIINLDGQNVLEIPDYQIKKINKTKYRVVIRDSHNPFILVLANNFDLSWQARIGKELLRNHIIVNGFANAWLIDKKGDYVVEIFYKVWPWD